MQEITADIITWYIYKIMNACNYSLVDIALETKIQTQKLRDVKDKNINTLTYGEFEKLLMLFYKLLWPPELIW